MVQTLLLHASHQHLSEASTGLLRFVLQKASTFAKTPQVSSFNTYLVLCNTVSFKEQDSYPKISNQIQWAKGICEFGFLFRGLQIAKIAVGPKQTKGPSTEILTQQENPRKVDLPTSITSKLHDRQEHCTQMQRSTEKEGLIMLVSVFKNLAIQDFPSLRQLSLSNYNTEVPYHCA